MSRHHTFLTSPTDIDCYINDAQLYWTYREDSGGGHTYISIPGAFWDVREHYLQRLRNTERDRRKRIKRLLEEYGL